MCVCVCVVCVCHRCIGVRKFSNSVCMCVTLCSRLRTPSLGSSVTWRKQLASLFQSLMYRVAVKPHVATYASRRAS